MQWFEILPGVYEVTTDLDIDLWSKALQELQNCGDGLADHYHTQPDQGARDLQLQGTACTEILEYFRSDDWYAQVTELCGSSPEWQNNWTAPSLSWIRRYTRFDYTWHRAPPVYTTHIWHVDCLKTVIHGMMYLSEHNDVTATTLFRDTDRDRAITTGFNKGWIILQNGQQLHRGINYSQQHRYTFKWMLTLDI